MARTRKQQEPAELSPEHDADVKEAAAGVDAKKQAPAKSSRMPEATV